MPWQQLTITRWQDNVEPPGPAGSAPCQSPRQVTTRCFLTSSPGDEATASPPVMNCISLPDCPPWLHRVPSQQWQLPDVATVADLAWPKRSMTQVLYQVLPHRRPSQHGGEIGKARALPLCLPDIAAGASLQVIRQRTCPPHSLDLNLTRRFSWPATHASWFGDEAAVTRQVVTNWEERLWEPVDQGPLNPSSHHPVRHRARPGDEATAVPPAMTNNGGRPWNRSLHCWRGMLRGRHVQTLQWRHNGHYGVSNHQPLDFLLNRLFRRRSKKTSKLRVTGLRAGNSPVTGEFPTQRASNAEIFSIWWRYHGIGNIGGGVVGPISYLQSENIFLGFNESWEKIFNLEI